METIFFLTCPVVADLFLQNKVRFGPCTQCSARYKGGIAKVDPTCEKPTRRHTDHQYHIFVSYCILMMMMFTATAAKNRGKNIRHVSMEVVTIANVQMEKILQPAAAIVPLLLVVVAPPSAS